jgi:toluene monooxygenase system protein E
MSKQRTYWHLEGLGRKPNEYDIATSKLLYYPERGFEVKTPMTAWYERHQRGSPLRATDWEAFRDPRETTYASYTHLQHQREIYVDGLLEAIDTTGYDARLGAAWIERLDRVLAPARYPMHGLQMIAAYVGSMAPSGRIAVALAFQTGDEMRRVQRFAYRMRQLQQRAPGFGAESRRRWQEDPAWQGFRRLIERLLRTYDWGEALVALNVVVKPAFDGVLGEGLARIAAAGPDEILAKVLRALDEDAAWQRAWTRALLDVAVSQVPGNTEVIEGWIDRWKEPAAAAVAALEPVLAGQGAAS